MADTEDKKGAARELVDTKFGTVDPASIVVKQGKDGKDFAVGQLVTGSKTMDVYARGKLLDELKTKAAAGEPFFVVGELLAKGKGISASSFEPKTYSVTVEKIGKEGENKSGPYVGATVKAEGKDKAWPVLVTGDEVARVKAAGVGGKLDLQIAWVADKDEERGWRTTAVSANSLKRAPAPAPEDAPTP